MFLCATEVTQDQQYRYNSPRGISCTPIEKASHSPCLWTLAFNNAGACLIFLYFLPFDTFLFAGSFRVS